MNKVDPKEVRSEIVIRRTYSRPKEDGYLRLGRKLLIGLLVINTGSGQELKEWIYLMIKSMQS